MAARPTSAFALSLAGGVLTLALQLLGVSTWFTMYSTNGTSFGYDLWYVVGSLSLTAVEGLVVILAGVACGAVVVAGAVLQHSGDRSRVKRGSVLVLIGTVVGAPATVFGWLLGGLLSVLGAALGLSWKPDQAM